MDPSGPPEWLLYASPAIALGAMIVAALALWLNRKTYKAGGPGVRLLVWPGDLTTDWRQVGIRVTVTNEGRAAVDVMRFVFLPDKTLKMYPQAADHAVGDPLPYRLESSSSRTWSLNPWPLLTAYEVFNGYAEYPRDPGERRRRINKKRIRRFKVEVLLGNGRKVRAKASRDVDLAALLDQRELTKRVYEESAPRDPNAPGSLN